MGRASSSYLGRGEWEEGVLMTLHGGEHGLDSAWEQPAWLRV